MLDNQSQQHKGNPLLVRKPNNAVLYIRIIVANNYAAGNTFANRVQFVFIIRPGQAGIASLPLKADQVTYQSSRYEAACQYAKTCLTEEDRGRRAWMHLVASSDHHR